MSFTSNPSFQALMDHLALFSQAALCLDLFSLLLGTADLEDGDLFQLAVHLFKLAQKHGQWDVDYAVRLLYCPSAITRPS
jgi:hypothetical protein